MPRGRRIVIERVIDDEWVRKLKTFNPEAVLAKKEKEVSKLHETVSKIVERSKRMYDRGSVGYVNESTLRNQGLLSLQEAYEYLIDHGLRISFRALGGRIERGTIPSVKIGRKRYIPVAALNHLLKLHEEFYTVREAYEKYKKYEPKLNFRAFIGRIEKGSIPSIKLGTMRLVPKVVLDSMIEVRKNYMTVSEAYHKLRKAGIKIKRSAFERRLDRGRIPFVKIAGKRYIPNDVVEELIDKELELRAKK